MDKLNFTTTLTLNLSGMSQAYENHCQLLVHEGRSILRLNPPLLERIRAHKEGARAELEKLMDANVAKHYPEGENYGSSGAQMSVASSFAFNLEANGMPKMLTEIFRLGRQCDLYEWDGTKSSCPMNAVLEAQDAINAIPR
jgi:hypothetical protein